MIIEYSAGWGYWLKSKGETLIEQTNYPSKYIGFFDWPSGHSIKNTTYTVALWKVKLKTN